MMLNVRSKNASNDIVQIEKSNMVLKDQDDSNEFVGRGYQKEVIWMEQMQSNDCVKRTSQKKVKRTNVRQKAMEGRLKVP